MQKELVLMSQPDQAERWAKLRSQQTQNSRISLEQKRSRMLHDLERFSVQIEGFLLQRCQEDAKPSRKVVQRTDENKQPYDSPLVKTVIKHEDGGLTVKTRTIGLDKETATAFILHLEPGASGYVITGIHCKTGSGPVSELSMDGSLQRALMLLQASRRFRALVAFTVADGLARIDPALPDLSSLGRSAIYRLSRLSLSSNPCQSIELASVLMHGFMICRDLTRIESVLRNIATAPARAVEDYKAEYERLCQIPRIESITVEDHEIRARTRCVYLHDKEGIQRRIGRFCIIINTEQGIVRVHNLNHKVGHHDHPHVSDGNPCWGNVHQYLASKTLEGAWPDVLLQTVEFVFSVNHRDCFCPVSMFPAAMPVE